MLRKWRIQASSSPLSAMGCLRVLLPVGWVGCAGGGAVGVEKGWPDERGGTVEALPVFKSIRMPWRQDS